jgi:ubiquinone biosynthesis protein UbiJ
MFPPVDPELVDVFGYLPNPTEESNDWFEKFRADAQLAGHLGQRGVDALAREVAHLDARTEQMVQNRTRLPAPASLSKTAGDWDEEINSDDHLLQKMETAGDRRRRNLRLWMQGELALNKSVSELVEHAQRHDPATARLIQEIGEELGA